MASAQVLLGPTPFCRKDTTISISGSASTCRMKLTAQMAYAGSPLALFRHSSRAMSPFLNACSKAWKLFLIALGIAIAASHFLSIDWQEPVRHNLLVNLARVRIG